VEEQMKKQQLISLWKDNNLLLKDYLLNGDLPKFAEAERQSAAFS